MKYIGLFFLSFIATIPAFAQWAACTDNGGTIIKANEYGNDQGNLCNNPNDANSTNNCNGLEFCMSGQNMNWWSAFVWCESIGGNLASFQTICPGVQIKSNNAQGACPNVVSVGSVWGWSGTGISTHTALAVHLSSGAVNDYHNSGYGRTHAYRAICER